jgi:hypothetical protein
VLLLGLGRGLDLGLGLGGLLQGGSLQGVGSLLLGDSHPAENKRKDQKRGEKRRNERRIDAQVGGVAESHPGCRLQVGRLLQKRAAMVTCPQTTQCIASVQSVYLCGVPVLWQAESDENSAAHAK